MFLTFPARSSKFNLLNCLKTVLHLQVTVSIRQNIFRQIFEESVSVKISPCQNFALYGMLSHVQKVWSSDCEELKYLDKDVSCCF